MPMEDRPILMGIVNLTPDSFYAASRVSSVEAALERIEQLRRRGCSIFDLGAVSTRPGAEDVPLEEEWARLQPVLEALASAPEKPEYEADHDALFDREEWLSIDTTSSEIVHRAYELIGPFIVNDISAGEDDPEMLRTVAELGLPFIAMHKRGNPRSMDALTDYPRGVVVEVLDYFSSFAERAASMGVKDWILDPGFGFAKTSEQNWALLEHLSCFKVFGRPVLAAVAHKRFTRTANPFAETPRSGTEYAQELAVLRGADILRIH